ncbi:hypothetical protein RQP46_010624 [Phenoliferia psychrophenolica]
MTDSEASTRDSAKAVHAEKGLALRGTTDLEQVEAPVSLKAYLLCGFASVGGVSALIAGDSAELIGRRPTIIAGCSIYTVGCILQTASRGLGLLVAGRLIAGLGVGFVSAIIILYMSEICPKKVRGALVSGYQWFITVGILLAACVNLAVQGREDTGSYRIPIAVQFAWGLILGIGLILLPESPRYFVKRGNIEGAANALGRLRGQPQESDVIMQELAEIVASAEFERQNTPDTGYVGSWLSCFSGGLWNGASNLRRTILGTSLQMMQQWTGVNFIFYFSTPFLQSTGAINSPFIISLIFAAVSVGGTPLSFYLIERLGRRPLLIGGAFGMLVCQFLVAIIGVTAGFNKTHLVDGLPIANSIAAVNAQIAFIALFIFFFACTWGPGAWVLIGEIFPLPIRARGVALSTASNWLWNTIITVIDKGDLRSSVFFIWGGLCSAACLYSYFLVPETRGLSLEQVDRMLQESTPRNSASWKPTTTYAAEAGLNADGHLKEQVLHIDDIASVAQKM